jgi:hypothetical protein
LKTCFFLQTLSAIAALALTTLPARADSPRVLLVHAGSGDPLTPHLVDELVAAGFTVEIVRAGEFDAKDLARSHSARAIVRVEPITHGIDLWADNKDTLIHIAEKPKEKGDLATLALRAVEALRGQLLASPPPKPEYAPEVPPANPTIPSISLPAPSTTPLVAPVRPTEPYRVPQKPRTNSYEGRFWFHVAPGAIMHPGGGGIGAGATALLGIRWMFLPRFGVDLFGTAPIVPSTVASPVGNVNVAASAVLVGGWADVFRPTPRLNFGLGAGIGPGVFHHYGQPQTSGIEARDGNVAYALPYVRTAVAWALTSHFSLRADLLSAIATPRPVLRLPGRGGDVYFGQPLLMIGLGLDLKLQ